MKEKSYWHQGITEKRYPTLSENLHVDVLIVGGGITGILCAYYLKDTGLRIALVEKNTFGSDMTGASTGKLTCLQGLIYQEIEKKYGYDVAYQYLQSQLDAIKAMQEILKKEKIECEYQTFDTYIYSNEIETKEKMEKEKEFFLRSNIEIIEKLPQDIYALTGFGIKNQGAFHPIKYIEALVEICQKAGVLFYENSNVHKIKEEDLMQEAYIGQYCIKSLHTILATRYPLSKGIHQLTVQLNQSITYLSTSDSKTMKFQSLCVDGVGKTMRPIKNGLLVGGYSHDVGSKNIFHKDVKKELQRCQDLPIQYFWSGQDCISGRILPFIGYYYHEDSYCYVATGFNKWGMTNSHVAAKLLTDIILKKKNDFYALFNPLERRYKITSNALMKLMKHSYLGYMKYRLQTTMSDHENIDGKIIFHKGKYIGLAFDDKKCLYRVNPVCTHLKGLLTYNPISKTWDCINHGSRFHLDGTVYKGPANKELKLFSKEGDTMKITYITLDQIEFEEVPYRASLYESVKNKGITIPLKAVFKEGKYYCVDGQQRLSIIKALQKEGITKKIAVIATNDGSTRSNDCWNGRNTH